MKYKPLFAAAAAALAAVAVLSCPRRIEACLGQEFHWQQVQQLQVYLSPADGADPIRFTLAPGDAAFEDLVERLDAQRWRCRPFDQSVRYTVELDYLVDLSFFDGTPHGLSFYGDRYLQLNTSGRLRDCAIAGLDSGESRAFQQELLDLLLAAAPSGET